jgi:hypothetical protein
MDLVNQRLPLAAIRSAVLAAMFGLCAGHAFAQTVVLKADDHQGTLSLKSASQAAGEAKHYAYTLALSTSDCKLSTSGIAAFYRKTDGMSDSAYLPDGDNVKTNQFIDHSAIGDVIITVDVESKRPKYANVMVDNPKPASNGCFKVKDGSYEFYGK